MYSAPGGERLVAAGEQTGAPSARCWLDLMEAAQHLSSTFGSASCQPDISRWADADFVLARIEATQERIVVRNDLLEAQGPCVCGRVTVGNEDHVITRLTARRTVVSMQYWVMHPQITSRLIPAAVSSALRVVSKNASQARLWMTGSPGSGAISGRIGHPGVSGSSL